MTIQHKPRATKNAAADAFVSNAPDALASVSSAYEKGVPKGNKRQISITIAPDMLRRVDERAKAMGTGRSAFITMALYNALNAD